MLEVMFTFANLKALPRFVVCTKRVSRCFNIRRAYCPWLFVALSAFKVFHFMLMHLFMCCRVVVKGHSGDEAVLCTQNKTFSLKAVFTSNMLLLVPAVEKCTAEAEPEGSGQEARGTSSRRAFVRT